MTALHQGKDLPRAKKSLEKWLDDYDAGQRQGPATCVVVNLFELSGMRRKLTLETCR